MKKVFLAGVLAVVGMAAVAQAKPVLGILPFTGGTAQDGETIANLFANSEDLREAFTIVMRTAITEGIMKEQEIQRMGLTDSDTIAELGVQLNANYVVSGHITNFRGKKLLTISIIGVKTFQQIAGDYREYKEIADIRALLPDMAKRVVAATRGASDANGLAVLPLSAAANVEQEEAEFLAQILATELANGHKYAVLPRTSTIERAMTEQEIQRSGLTDKRSIAAIGEATNARYVLSGTITNLGNVNLFDVKIFDVENGGLITGKDIEYRNLEDGIDIMRELAYLLTGIKTDRYLEIEARAAALTATETDKKKEAEQDRQKSERTEAFRAALRGKNGERLLSIGLNVASTFATPWLVGNLNITFSILPNTFIEAGFEAGILHGNAEDAETKIEDVDYHSWYPYGRFNLLVPFGLEGGWYLGAGAGYMMAYYDFPQDSVNVNTVEFDAATGIYAGVGHNLFRMGYAVRTDFKNVSHQILMGWTFRIY
jgi:TolB-like protein